MKLRQSSLVILFLVWCTNASAILVDPSVFANGLDISGAFSGVTLSRAHGSLSTSGPTISVPLHLISDAVGPVFSTSGLFGHSGGVIWAAGECCGGDTVLRIDFLNPASSVEVLFLPDDNDSPVFQAYDAGDNRLFDAYVIAGSPTTLKYSATVTPIAYVLATYGDTGRIRSVSYEIANISAVPEPPALALIALGLVSMRRAPDTRHTVAGIRRRALH